MMTERILLASEDDDLYAGYNEFHPVLDIKVSSFFLMCVAKNNL